jgi:hypothetical protein
MAERSASKSDVVLDDELTIHKGQSATQPGASLDHPAIGYGPVAAMTGKGSDPAPIDDDQGAIAVMLDLVYPALSEGGSGTNVGISGLIKPRGTGGHMPAM